MTLIAATETIAGLLASGRIEGDVTITGVVARLDVYRSAAGHDWAVAVLDDRSGELEVHLLPRTWLAAVRLVHLSAELSVSGRLNATRDGLHVIGLTVEAP
jgi:DNA polymerase III alpha subunit